MAESSKKKSAKKTTKKAARTKAPTSPTSPTRKKVAAAKAAATTKKVKPVPAAEPAKAAPAKTSSGALQIKLVRSLIGSSPHQRAVVAGLGLRRLNQTVTRKDTREIRGMVAKVPHLVNILS